jgi:hypothetical protein
MNEKINKDVPGQGQRNPKWKKFAAILGIFAALVIAFHAYQWWITPRLNENPSKVFEISGAFPFDQGLDLTLTAYYSTNSIPCRQMARVFLIFPAAEVNREIRVHLPITRVGQNRYTTKVALDHYAGGACEWAWAGMSYKITGGKLPKKQISESIGPIPARAAKIDLRCRYFQMKDKRQGLFCNNDKYQEEPNLTQAAELNFFLQKDQ